MSKNNLTRETKYLLNSRCIFLPFFSRRSPLITSQLNYFYYTPSNAVNRKLGMRAHSPEIKCRHFGREGFFPLLVYPSRDEKNFRFVIPVTVMLCIYLVYSIRVLVNRIRP